MFIEWGGPHRLGRTPHIFNILQELSHFPHFDIFCNKKQVFTNFLACNSNLSHCPHCPAFMSVFGTFCSDVCNFLSNSIQRLQAHGPVANIRSKHQLTALCLCTCKGSPLFKMRFNSEQNSQCTCIINSTTILRLLTENTYLSRTTPQSSRTQGTRLLGSGVSGIIFCRQAAVGHLFRGTYFSCCG